MIAMLLASLAIPAAFEGDALLIDYVGGAVRGIEGWRLSPGHFAERHGLIVIIALGVVVAAALWWIYFDDALDHVEQHLHAASGRARNVMARDAFSFLHLPLVAGIVLLALGVKKTLGDVDEPLKLVSATALFGGPALAALAGVAAICAALVTYESLRLTR